MLSGPSHDEKVLTMVYNKCKKNIISDIDQLLYQLQPVKNQNANDVMELRQKVRNLSLQALKQYAQRQNYTQTDWHRAKKADDFIDQ